MPYTELSPNVDNYFVGSGIIKIRQISPVDEVDYRDVGNVSKFEFTSNVTRLKHYSSRVGTRFKDKDVVTQVDATLAMVMDEITAANLQYMLLSTNTGTSPVMMDILTQPNLEVAVRMIGTNDVGAKVQVDLPSVLLTPNGALGLINNATWGEIPLTAEVNGDATTGSFGRVAVGTDGTELTDFPA